MMKAMASAKATGSFGAFLRVRVVLRTAAPFRGDYMSQTLTNPADGNKKKLMPLFIKAAVALAAVAVILVLTVQLSESMMM